MNKVSLTLTGLVVSVLALILPKMGVSVLESDLATTVSTIIAIVGGVAVYVGRVRQGDVNLLGVKKKVL